MSNHQPSPRLESSSGAGRVWQKQELIRFQRLFFFSQILLRSQYIFIYLVLPISVPEARENVFIRNGDPRAKCRLLQVDFQNGHRLRSENDGSKNKHLVNFSSEVCSHTIVSQMCLENMVVGFK